MVTITTVLDTDTYLFTKGQSFREIHGSTKKANYALITTADGQDTASGRTENIILCKWLNNLQSEFYNRVSTSNRPMSLTIITKQRSWNMFRNETR